MKNLNYFPFERGRYFYGKLLTVDDFETEQRYMNDKRRLVNRFLHGTGVVSGMNTVRVDDRTISVEMGLALDFAGREIVVDTPVIRKLELLDGYDQKVGEDGYVYLCIEYAEKETEPVHSIASSGSGVSDGVENNKFSEGYRLFVTAQEPENEGFTVETYFQDTTTVYWGNGIRVKQSIRRFVEANGACELVVTVENMGQQQSFIVDYEVALTCLQYQGADKLHVHFDQRDYARSGRYQLRFPLQAMDVADAAGSVSVVGDSFALAIDQRSVVAQGAGVNQCRIVTGDAKAAMVDQYYKSAMEDIVRNTYQQSIYLAKLSLIQAGPSYYIETVEPMPFGQYVFNNSLGYAMYKLGLGQGGGQAEAVAPAVHVASQVIPQTVNSGTIVMDLGIGGTEGQRFFSTKVSHGLGLGAVHVSAGICYDVNDDDPVVYGSSEVFDEKGEMVHAEVATKVDVTQGTFVVGIRMTRATAKRSVRLHWTAVRDVKEQILDQNQKALFLKPDVCELGVREDRYFEAIFENVSDTRVKWSVKEAHGGEIDQNGRYIAPNVVGVYQICAQSVAHPELTATTYVVVREG